MTLPTNSHQKGIAFEEIAYSFLKDNGLELVERNYRSPRGEIDLIMNDNDLLVFIEVRARRNNHLMNVLETIGERKRSSIIYTSQHYLQHCKLTYKKICRFDIVLLTGIIESTNIEWIRNAFEA